MILLGVVLGRLPAEPARYQRNDVGAGHRGGGDQCTGSGGHHGCHTRCEDDAAEANRQDVLGNGGVYGVAVLNPGHKGCGSGSDQGTGDTVEHAVNTGCGATPAGNARRAGGEDALPDVLSDQQSQRVDHEEGDDGLHADGGWVEGGLAKAVDYSLVTAGCVPGEGQHQREEADRHQAELDNIGQRDGPHSTDRGVDHDNAAANQHAPEPIDVEQHREDGRVRGGGRDRKHQGVAEHHHGGRLGGTRAITQGQHLGNREDLQFLDGAGEEEADGQHAAGDGEHEPHPGNAELETEGDAADRGSTAEHQCGHGSGVQERPKPPAGDQVIAGILGPALAPPAKREHGEQIQDDDDDVQVHWASGAVVRRHPVRKGRDAVVVDMV